MATEHNTGKPPPTPEQKARWRENRARVRREKSPEDRELRLAKEREQKRIKYAQAPKDSSDILKRRERERAWREANPEKCLAYTEKYLSANKDRLNAEKRIRWADDKEHVAKAKAQAKRWREENAEANRDGKSRWYQVNRDAILSKSRERYVENREEHLAAKKRWFIENKDRVAEYKRAWRAANPGYDKKRYDADPFVRLSVNLRSRVYAAIKWGRGKKSAKTIDLIGCDIDFLKAHIEAQFSVGMTWENYGRVWHVDHIMPVATFNLADPNEQRECFNFCNLRPLLAEENRSRRRHPRYYRAEVPEQLTAHQPRNYTAA